MEKLQKHIICPTRRSVIKSVYKGNILAIKLDIKLIVSVNRVGEYIRYISVFIDN